LACARGGLIFSLINPNFANAGQLHYALKKGEFQWSTHQLAAIQFTTGTSAPAKLVGLSHYQLINGCRVAAEAMGGALCCALPLFKIPVFALVALAPFVRGTRVLFPSPSPLPKFLFDSIKKHQLLLTNAVALRLVLKIALARKIELPSVKTVILIGERVPLDLLKNIPKQFQNANKIFV
uniref:AMP-dependent synthetase/ligase domain-containing protein n=1 Tax=Parascaris equorum TaxID=6256 RepID=A0A914RKK5_PAREQ